MKMRVVHWLRRHARAAVLLLVPAIPPPVPAAATDTLRWGEPAGGLQMAVAVEPDAGLLHGWIRNGEISNVTVNNYFLGYFRHLHLEVRNAAGWKRLDRAANDMRVYTGMGPGKSNVELLRPNQAMIGKRFFDLAMGRNFADLPSLTGLNDSFSVDLGDFTWPVELASQDKIEIRVVQELSGPGLDAPVVVCSPPIDLDGPQFRNVLDQLNYGAIYNRDFQDHPPRPSPPAAPPPGGNVIFKQDLPGGMKMRLEKAVTTQDEDGPLGRKAYTYCSYTLLAAEPGGPDVIVWVKRGPVSYSQSKRRPGIVPFEAVEHEGWLCLLYTYFSGLCLDTFRIDSDGKSERWRTGLGSFPLAPSDKAVGFQRAGKELKVVFTRSPDEFPRSDRLFAFKEGKPGWLQLPAKKSVKKERPGG